MVDRHDLDGHGGHVGDCRQCEIEQLRAENARLKKDVKFYMSECDEIAKAKVDLQNDLALWQAQGQSNDLVDENRALREENARLNAALDNHLCPEDKADWIACTGHPDGCCEVCADAPPHAHQRQRAEEAEKLLDEATDALEEWWCESGTKGDVLMKLRARKEGKRCPTPPPSPSV